MSDGVVNMGATPSGFSGQGGSDQWLRRITLMVYNESSGDALNFTPANIGPSGELIHIRCRFEVTRVTTQTPNLLNARIYNLNMSNGRSMREFNRVVLAAGYQTGRFGQLFDGTVIVYKTGKESAVDSYLDIIAGDGDKPTDFTHVAKLFPAGTKRIEIFKHCAEQMGQYGATMGEIDLGKAGDIKSLRATSVCGMARDVMRDIANSCNADWSIHDGKVTALPREGYAPGDVVVLNPQTGLVGMPEVTESGIVARCLLNPMLRIGGRVKIEGGLLSGVPYTPGSTTMPGAVGSTGEVRVAAAGRGNVFTFAATSPTGTYKIMLLKHMGDTRDNPWYSEMVCLALDQNGEVIPTVNSVLSRKLSVQSEAGAPKAAG